MTDSMKLYRAPSGREFCYRPESFADNSALLYSPDGSEFFMTKAGPLSGATVGGFYRKVKLQFEELYNGVTGVLDFDNNRIVYDGETYECVGDVPAGMEYWQLPKVRTPEFLARIDMTDLMVYISSSYHDPSPEKFRAFFGNDNGYEEFEIIEVHRQAGRLMSLQTNHGRIILHSRYVIDDAFVPQWNGIDLELLNPSDFDITEIHGGPITIASR